MGENFRAALLPFRAAAGLFRQILERHRGFSRGYGAIMNPAFLVDLIFDLNGDRGAGMLSPFPLVSPNRYFGLLVFRHSSSFRHA